MPCVPRFLKLPDKLYFLIYTTKFGKFENFSSNEESRENLFGFLGKISFNNQFSFLVCEKKKKKRSFFSFTRLLVKDTFPCC